ncbi:hypothetical protein FSP39_008973 [Pinctada imbricata]|uniref:PHD-type domain-containing protein n=1 Tax=Pinctada imbricata TaxID=66713 RepID=A0AA88XW14_PINIB|nr:hypothetical protein FSP39_008973 [Pinctada imbricata]
MGYTSCTSSKCEWVVPKERSLEPAMIKDMTFERSQHGKAGKTRPPLGHKKRDYNPLPQTDDSRLTEHNESEEDEFFSTFTDELRKSLPNACLFKEIKSNCLKNENDEEEMDVDEEKENIVGDTYFCPCCSELKSLRERSVCCNICGLWYHYRCVNLAEAKVKKISSWHCEECSM